MKKLCSSRKRAIIYQLVRNLIQIGCLILMPGLFVDAFNGVRGFIQNIMVWDPLAAFISLIPCLILIVITIVFGRVFCGFVCAFGTLMDFMSFIGRKVFRINLRMPERVDKYLKYLKYLILAAFIVLWIVGIDLPTFASPWSAFGTLMAIPPDFPYVVTSMTVGAIILLIIMIGSLFIDRFFCRYICPLGAILALVSHFRITKIKKPRTDCGSCKLCTSKCKMGIPLYKTDKVTSGECILCMKCIPECRNKNVKVAVAPGDAAPVLLGAVAATTIGLSMLGTAGQSALSAQKEQAPQAVTSEASSTALSSSSEASSVASSEAAPTTTYKDGVYEGSAIGFRNRTTTVSVTIENDVITDIQTVSTGDDKKYYDSAFNSVVAQILNEQTTDVDSVTGATFSSDGIIDAVADALSKAKNDSSSTSTSTDTSSTQKSTTSSSTEKASSAEQYVEQEEGDHIPKRDGSGQGKGNGTGQHKNSKHYYTEE